MSFSILFFLFYSSVPPVQNSTAKGGRTQIDREPGNIYEDPDAMVLPVGFKNRGKQYPPMICSSFYTFKPAFSIAVALRTILIS